jgi:hypothetical protein
MELMQTDANLPHVVLAAGAIGDLANFLNRRQQKTDHHRDDRDDDEKLQN